MVVPEKFMNIMAKFQRALKTEDFTEIDLISLKDLRLAKAHLINDKGSAYYPLLLDKIAEKESSISQPEPTKEPLIFMSYDTRDIDLVKAIDGILHRVFKKSVKTFIAKRDIKAGDDAFKTMLHQNLAKCVVVLAICTKRSVTSPWLWFESGAGFEKSGLIPVWSGVKPQEFKAPMTIFQGKNIRDRVEIHELLSKLAELINFNGENILITDEEFERLVVISNQLDSEDNNNNILESSNIPSVSYKVFCQRCGAIPGQKSDCNGSYSKHDFTAFTELVYCERCGAMPGQKNECNGTYTKHDFRPLRESVYCDRCGATPGPKSECNGTYTKHDFRTA